MGKELTNGHVRHDGREKAGRREYSGVGQINSDTSNRGDHGEGGCMTLGGVEMR